MSHTNFLIDSFAAPYCHTLKGIYGICLIGTGLASSFAYLRWEDKNNYISTKISRALYGIEETLSMLGWICCLFFVITECKNIQLFKITAIVVTVCNGFYCLIIYSDIYFSDESDSEESDI